jgi:Phage integrase, N-terminal SAM-like domain
MARYQHGSVRIEQRSDGPTWVYRFYVTRSDGKRVEHKASLGLVNKIGATEKHAWQEVDRQRLRDNANKSQPFRGKPTTFRQLCQHYMENELQEDQSNATIEKAYTTAETYKRILNNRVIPRFGRKSPLAIEPLEVEHWLRELKKVENLQSPTLDKIRRVMNLVYKHGQRYGLIARDASVNPMTWVRQKTTSSYVAVVMNPRQAFEILLNIPEPRRTLVLTDAATALRVSEVLGLTWMDLNFEDQVIQVRRAYVWGHFKSAQVEGFQGASAYAPGAGRLSDGMEGEDAICEGQGLRFPKLPSKGQEALVCFHHGAEVPASCGRQGRRHQRRSARPFRISQLPALIGFVAGEAEV